MRLHVGSVGADEPAELAVAHALLRRASGGEIDEALRIRSPRRPAVVFGRRDTLLPGFPAARAAAVEAGFQVGVRAVGGRAVAYTSDALVIDHVRREPEPAGGLERRFAEYGEALASVLRGFGIDARVGAVPGEYCPGAESVNARGTVKLAGTAQRVIRQAWLFSVVVTFDGRERLGPVLSAVYGHLDLPFDPASVGTVTAEAPGTQLADLSAAVLAAHGHAETEAEPLDEPTLRTAEELLDQHRC